jgi:hypothetical protein
LRSDTGSPTAMRRKMSSVNMSINAPDGSAGGEVVGT